MRTRRRPTDAARGCRARAGQMTGRDPALTLRAPAVRELRVRLYRALASELAYAPARSAVLIETSTAWESPYVTVSPPELAAPVLLTPSLAGTERVEGPPTLRADGAGRWALLTEAEEPVARGDAEAAGRAAARRDAQVESACRMLLRRYGVVFRDVLARETTAPTWRELVAMFRRLEARGVVRGGRFVSGFGGEQFARPEAADALRAGRNRTLAEMPALTIAAADPMNLIGVVIPGDRVAAIAGNTATLPPPSVGPVEAAVPEMPVAHAFAWDGPANRAEQEGGAIA